MHTGHRQADPDLLACAVTWKLPSPMQDTTRRPSAWPNIAIPKVPPTLHLQPRQPQHGGRSPQCGLLQVPPYTPTATAFTGSRWTDHPGQLPQAPQLSHPMDPYCWLHSYWQPSGSCSFWQLKIESPVSARSRVLGVNSAWTCLNSTCRQASRRQQQQYAIR